MRNLPSVGINKQSVALDLKNTFNKFLESCLYDFNYFTEYCKYNKLTSLHKKWFEHLFLSKSNLSVLLAHRNSYKTTTLILGVSLLLLCDPKLTILIVRKSEDLATQMVSEIKSILSKFENILKHIHNINVSYTTNKIYLHSVREPNIYAVGITKNITGLHFDLIICDDIVSDKDRYSRRERDNTIKFFFETKNILKPDGKLILTGTPWHKEDLFSLIDSRHILKCDVYSSGLFTQDKINELRSTMPLPLFACNYELRHINSQEVYFTDERYYNSNRFDLLLLEKKIPMYMHIDPAFDGKDYTAITLLAIVSEYEYVVNGFVYRENIFTILQKVLNLITNYNVTTVYIESNSDQGSFANELRKHINIRIISYKETKNKHIKIVDNITKHWHKIYFVDNIQKEYLSQILEYSDFADHDDAADSLASLLQKITTTSNSSICSFEIIGDNNE